MTHNYPCDEAATPIDPAILRAAVRRIADVAASRAVTEDIDGGFPHRDIAALHAAGLLLAPFPVTMGGVDIGNAPNLLREVLTTLGRGSLSLGRLYEGHVNAVKLVGHYGTASNLRLLLAEALVGVPTGVWMAEAGEPLRLTGDGATRRIEGRKILASGSGHFRRPLIAAKTPEGSRMIIPFVADPMRADASGWTTLGMRATATGTVDFSGIVVGDDEIVGEPDDYLRSPLFRGGAWRVLAVQLGGLETILDLYKAQLAESRNADDPLQLARFGEALIATETARLWVERASTHAEETDDDPIATDAYVDLARNAFERSALDVIALAQKAIGLRAFLRPNPLERVLRDLSTYLRQPALDGSLTSAAAYHLGRQRDASH